MILYIEEKKLTYELVRLTTERIIPIEEKLEENQGTHNCYVDNPKQYLVFEFGDYVILKFAY